MGSERRSSGDERRGEETSDSTPSDPGQAALVAELETLRAETDRLRSSYVRARRSQYRWTAVGFAVLGLLVTAGGVLFPATRTILLALGGTGLFAAVLTWFITPERFVSASVGDAVYEALARNHDRLCRDLGLADERIYVPTDDVTTGVRLFVPQRTAFRIPDADDLDSLFVVTDDEATRGVSLRPTGETLFREFERALNGPLGDTPDEVVVRAREAVVEQFEIATDLETDLDRDEGRLSLRTVDSTYGELARFDHPVVSTVAVALARGVDRPIRVELTTGDDALATLRWDTTVAATEADEGTTDATVRNEA